MQDRSGAHVVAREHAVLIVGAGPTGLMLAGELALAGVDVAIVERRSSQELAGVRAGGLHMRTLELLDQRGLAERFIMQGQPHRAAPFARTTLDLSDSLTRHNYYLALWQTRVERLLTAWVGQRSVPIYRGAELADFAQDERGVDVWLADGQRMRAGYLVGCDGGRSSIRKRAGIGFPGWDATTSYLIAEVELSEEPLRGVRRSERGMAAIGALEDGQGARVVVSERQLGGAREPSLDDVRDALVAHFGTDYGLRSAGYLSRFTDMTRQAAAYRSGRVLLAGDAAHVHSPMGGQGLNLGVHDAVNLGWKLAQVSHGTSPDSLLDSYHAERHPAAARVLRTTMALTALEREDARSEALRETVCDMMQLDVARQQYVAMISGLDVRYDLGQGHPLLGRRMPDLSIDTHEGLRRVYTLLHDGRPLLLSFGGPLALEVAPWAERVRRLEVQYEGAWELPVIGAVPAPSGVLVRPDGYVAWVGEQSAGGLREALSTWFGPGRG